MPLRDYSETGDDNELDGEKSVLVGVYRACLAVLFHMPSVARYAYVRFVSKKKPVIKRIGIRNFMEMEPKFDNRITLSDKRDANGEFIPVVSHKPSEIDRRSLILLYNVLVGELAKNDIGELKTGLETETEWPINQDASHHLGATRMGNDPTTSVVNKDLRLHGAENVYCAGGSVFSTSGCANPTFTICALSIRLADHFKKILL